MSGAVLLLALLACAGCAPRCPSGLAPMQETTLFFGGSVPDLAWGHFAADILTPAFSEGLTVTAAAGQWRDPRSGDVIKEGARVVRVFGHPPRATIEGVRAAYRARFDQQSVGLAIGRACAAF